MECLGQLKQQEPEPALPTRAPRRAARNRRQRHAAVSALVEPVSEAEHHHIHVVLTAQGDTRRVLARVRQQHVVERLEVVGYRAGGGVGRRTGQNLGVDQPRSGTPVRVEQV